MSESFSSSLNCSLTFKHIQMVDTGADYRIVPHRLDLCSLINRESFGDGWKTLRATTLGKIESGKLIGLPEQHARNVMTLALNSIVDLVNASATDSQEGSAVQVSQEDTNEAIRHSISDYFSRLDLRTLTDPVEAIEADKNVPASLLTGRVTLNGMNGGHVFKSKGRWPSEVELVSPPPWRFSEYLIGHSQEHDKTVKRTLRLYPEIHIGDVPTRSTRYLGKADAESLAQYLNSVIEEAPPESELSRLVQAFSYADVTEAKHGFARVDWKLRFELAKHAEQWAKDRNLSIDSVRDNFDYTQDIMVPLSSSRLNRPPQSTPDNILEEASFFVEREFCGCADEEAERRVTREAMTHPGTHSLLSLPPRTLHDVLYTIGAKTSIYYRKMEEKVALDCENPDLETEVSVDVVHRPSGGTDTTERGATPSEEDHPTHVSVTLKAWPRGQRDKEAYRTYLIALSGGTDSFGRMRTVAGDRSKCLSD